MPEVIAEFCQNHRGDRHVLHDMIWLAAEAGADYAKIQSIRASDLTFRSRFEHGLTVDGAVRCIRRPFQPEYDRLRPMDLDEETHRWFIEECVRAGIRPLTTAFTRGQIPFLAGLGWKAIKVASYDCASYPMLQELRDRFDHLFVSTGGTHDCEIEQAAAILSRGSFTYLHCVTVYPTPLDQLHLARLSYLRTFTPSVGFSDHTLVARDGLTASIAAIAIGADVIERHFTILPADATKDGPVSLTPALFAELVSFARRPIEEVQSYVRDAIPDASIMTGQAKRAFSTPELLNRDYYRGRFATHVDGRIIDNWQADPLA